MERETVEAAQRYLEGPINNLQPGEWVRWKKGCKNMNAPDYDEPIMVIEVFDSPLVDVEKPGSGYYGEKYDFRAFIGADEDGDAAFYAFNSWRFERCNAPELT